MCLARRGGHPLYWKPLLYCRALSNNLWSNSYVMPVVAQWHAGATEPQIRRLPLSSIDWSALIPDFFYGRRGAVKMHYPSVLEDLRD